jgi:hypothetical protein
VKADESGAFDQVGIQLLPREIERSDLVAFSPEPRSRRREPEWLAAEFVSCDQYDPQTTYYPTATGTNPANAFNSIDKLELTPPICLH